MRARRRDAAEIRQKRPSHGPGPHDDAPRLTAAQLALTDEPDAPPMEQLGQMQPPLYGPHAVLGLRFRQEERGWAELLGAPGLMA
ncbi:hypothetical protein ACIQU6_08575 [Streptomyces sp. NPDC090442]|uniref:hypothetical protein n=1 Tax=Streptomyces sp. NPDC090442 TaxID=3365962 RepID=UPI0037F860C3